MTKDTNLILELCSPSTSETGYARARKQKENPPARRAAFKDHQLVAFRYGIDVTLLAEDGPIAAFVTALLVRAGATGRRKGKQLRALCGRREEIHQSV